MDERKKTLLGNKDILSRKTQDFYVDVNLSIDNREIIPYKYDNIFDLTKFYNKERNECRSFVIYGIIDSYVCDCNNLTIKIYDSTSLYSNLLSTVQTQDIVSTQMQFPNIYGRLKGKYIIDNIPVNYTGYSVFLKLESTDSFINQQIQDNVFEQQLIFTTLTMSSSGEKVVEKLNYGLNEAVTDCDGNVFEINNDFDFFYNKHWIKKNLSVSNLNRIWIGNEETKFCETQQNPIYHGRTVYGVFNTGYFAYGEVMEVYEINTSSTGNYEPNTGTTHYIPHVPSNGLCPTTDTYSFTFERVFSAATGNLIWTASIIWPYENAVNIFPLNPNSNGYPYYETQLMKTEPVSGINIYNSYINTYWDFLYFRYQNGQQFTGDTFNFNITQNTIIEGVYQEICPLSLYVNPVFINPNYFSEPAAPYSSVTYNQNSGQNHVNKKTKFSNGEQVQVIISQPYYYIDDFNITGSSLVQNNYTPSNFASFMMMMTEDTYVDLFYKKFLTLDVVTATTVSKTHYGHNQDLTGTATGGLKLDIFTPVLPSTQQSTTGQVMLPSGYTMSPLNLFDQSQVYISTQSNWWPQINPKVGEIYTAKTQSWEGVFVLNQGGGSTFYDIYEEMPGTWFFTGTTAGGATIIPSSPNLLHIYVTGNTEAIITWIFTPAPHNI